LAKIKYPRRILIRSFLKGLISAALHTFSDFEVIGAENIPAKGPLILTANHFSFSDSIAMLHIAPPSIEMFSGANPAFTPWWGKLLPRLWGVLYVYRGTGSRQAIRDAESILKQEGFFGIFPEGGAWAEMIRPARPGAAYLAARSGAPFLPIGFAGLIKSCQLDSGIRVKFPLGLENPINLPLLPGGGGSADSSWMILETK